MTADVSIAVKADAARLALRPLAAETLGSALLSATVIGSGIMAERLAEGNAAIALLGNTAATAAILFVLISLFGPVSGAHFNPAVTLVFALRREIEWRTAALYTVLQIAGCVLGAVLAHLMFDMDLIEASTKARSGPAQWFSEGVATFTLVLVILGLLRTRPGALPAAAALPAAVALTIAAGYWFTASTSFANPAITIARALTDSFAGIAPGDVPGFIGAQFAGAVLALLTAHGFGWRTAEHPSTE